MIRSIRKRVTYGNVMATIAVFLVLGGGAAVAAGLKKNAVKTKNIKNGAVTTVKLGNDAVTGDKAKESTFGIVPLAANANSAASAAKAAHAETATEAAHAASATTATTAASATSAETATKAKDTELFAGRQVSGIRTGSNETSSVVDVNLAPAGSTVLSLDAPVAATSDLIANASIRVTNNGTQGFVECQLQNEGDGTFPQMSFFSGTTMPAGNTVQIALTGSTEVTQKGFVDPETVRVLCKAANVGGPFTFEQGDLTVERVPIG